MDPVEVADFALPSQHRGKSGAGYGELDNDTQSSALYAGRDPASRLGEHLHCTFWLRLGMDSAK